MKKKKQLNLGKVIVLIFSLLIVFFGVLTGCNSSGKKSPATTPAEVGKKVAETPVEEKDTKSYKDKIAAEQAAKKDREETVRKGPIQGKTYSILVKKSAYTLTLFQDNTPIAVYKVAIGKNPGQKQAVGDLRTPDGDFTVDELCDATYWTHDFGDGKGEIKGAYGPFFISLRTPGWSGIGIHGTHDPASLGTRASEGCVRMNNKDLVKIKPFVQEGTKVKIEE